MFGEQTNRTRISLKSQPRYIYALIDPRDNTPRYIGMTKNVYFRLERHIKDKKTKDKAAWIAELEQLGMHPELEILETIEAMSNIDDFASEREKYWIDKFLQSGTSLLNVLGTAHNPPSQPRVEKISPSTLFSEAMKQAGLTIDQLCIEANVSLHIVRKIESDEPVSGPLAGRVCKVLSRYLGQPVTYRDLQIKIYRR